MAVCREACIDFKELWKKKHVDDLWIKEVAAMQSCLLPANSFPDSSGIILANEIPSPDQNNKINSKDDEKNGSLETPNSATSNQNGGIVLFFLHFLHINYCMYIGKYRNLYLCRINC